MSKKVKKKEEKLVFRPIPGMFKHCSQVYEVLLDTLTKENEQEGDIRVKVIREVGGKRKKFSYEG